MWCTGFGDVGGIGAALPSARTWRPVDGAYRHAVLCAGADYAAASHGAERRHIHMALFPFFGGAERATILLALFAIGLPCARRKIDEMTC